MSGKPYAFALSPFTVPYDSFAGLMHHWTKYGLSLLLFVLTALSSANEDEKPTPWSFREFQTTELPKIRNKAFPKTQIDHFLLAKMEAADLEPAPAADNRTLVRRVYFDLIGLPPSPEQIDQFDGNLSALIDELLASPHYGERWGRHWLDLARYTDTTASWLKSASAAWLYRDWVVNAFNEDMPYDEFIRRQLATDQIEETGPEDSAALGFLGLSPTYWKELQLPPEIIKGTVADEWEEHVDALGKTFLGLTLGCARCHDHKNDPISTKDYYALAGVFASVKFSDRPTMDEKTWAPVAKAMDEVAKLDKQLADLKKKKPEDLKELTAAIQKKIDHIKSTTQHYDVPMASGVVDAALFVEPKSDGKHGTDLKYKDGEARDVAVHQRGDPNTPGEIVPRGFLGAFPDKTTEKARKFTRGSGRLDLAAAIVEDATPLTARVIVNRVWRHHFGRGLVETPSDFGNGGEAPTHPELLDDLAARFVSNGWSIKWLHREILNSATWQQATPSEKSREKDPANQFYSGMNPRRLDVEAWRDSLLQVSGKIDLKTGGAPLDLKSDTNLRRTIYGKIERRDLDNMLRLHDFPDPTAHSPKRPETTTPLQLLFSLNGPFFEKQAEALAARTAEGSADSAARIDRTFRILFQRSPTESERRMSLELVSGNVASDWKLFSHALLASNEFLFVD